MRTRRFKTALGAACCLAWIAAVHAAEPAGEGDNILVKDFEDAGVFSPNPDNGNPPEFKLDETHVKQGKHSLKLVYKNGKNAWGNLKTPLELTGSEEAISFWLFRESSATGAVMHLWLFESDGDGWLSKPIGLDTLQPGWNQVRAALKDFAFEKRGPGTPDRTTVDKLLLGCNLADFTAYIDDLRLEGKDLKRKREEWMKTQSVITIDLSKVIKKDFMGFGAEWDPRFWQAHNLKLGVNEADWDLIGKRIRWMRLPIVRMMILAKWCYLGGGKYDWESQDMRSMYRHLDVCQKEGITVLLTDWGCTRDWERAPGFDLQGTADPKYAGVIGEYMDYLVNKTGYSCIKYFILINEPNNEAESWESWRKGVENVSGALSEKRLKDKIVFIGSDYCQDSDNWHRQAVDQLSSVLGAYDLHRYASDAEVRSGGLEAYVRRQWDYAHAKDAKAANKPFIIAESGRLDGGFSAQANQSIGTYEYGLFMSDYAVQAVRAGSSAMLAWMLDDSSHEGFSWGLWPNKAGGFKLRPWFYTWSLFTRYFPRGSKMITVDQPRDARVLAAEIPASTGKKKGVTICLVNRRQASRAFTLKIPKVEELVLKRYVYSRESARTDENGFPVPVAEEKADMLKGYEVTCPAESAVFLTSLDF